MQKTVLISLDGPSLEALIFDAVDKAIRLHHPTPPPHTSANAAPIMGKAEVQAMTGWPAGTLYGKVREMPEGVVIRGKSKRLLFDRVKFVEWLQTPGQP